MEKVNLAEKFGLFEEYWSPKVVGELNGQVVKLAKLKGEFIWHQHAEEDELFMVIQGQLTVQFREREVALEAGELLIVPRGVEHRPVAAEEAWVLLFEPRGTLNTGEARSERTVEAPEWI